MTNVDLMFKEQGVGACFSKNGSAHAHIRYSPVFVGVSHPKLIFLAVIVKDTTREEVVMRRIGHVRIDVSIRARCYDDRLLVVIVPVERQEEGRLLAVTQRTCERSFIVGTLF